MRIALIGRELRMPRGGAELSALALLKELARNHEIFVLETHQGPCEIKYPVDPRARVWVLPRITHWRVMPSELRRLMAEFLLRGQLSRWADDIRPQLLITQHFFIFTTQEDRIPTVVFIRDNSGIAMSAPWLSKFYNAPFAALRRKHLQQADLVLANSEHMAGALRHFGIDSEVVYPFINLEAYRVQHTREPEFITFIRPEPWKGLDIAISIAKRMPMKRFLFVGNASAPLRDRIAECENIELSEWCSDMRKIYQRTELVIMPSVWEEAFGRVPIEAGINGIPTVASDRGGLPESVGEGGILIRDPYDIDAWVTAIEMVNSDWQTFSLKAYQHAQNFSFEKTYEMFREAVKKHLGLVI